MKAFFIKGHFVPGRGSTRDKRPPPYISSPRPLFQHLAFCAVDPPRRRRPELRAAPTESSAPPPRELRAAAPRPRDRRRVVAPTTARRTSPPSAPPSSSPSAARRTSPPRGPRPQASRPEDRCAAQPRRPRPPPRPCAAIEPSRRLACALPRPHRRTWARRLWAAATPPANPTFFVN